MYATNNILKMAIFETIEMKQTHSQQQQQLAA